VGRNDPVRLTAQRRWRHPLVALRRLSRGGKEEPPVRTVGQAEDRTPPESIRPPALRMIEDAELPACGARCDDPRAASGNITPGSRWQWPSLLMGYQMICVMPGTHSIERSSSCALTGARRSLSPAGAARTRPRTRERDWRRTASFVVMLYQYCTPPTPMRTTMAPGGVPICLADLPEITTHFVAGLGTTGT